MKYKLDIQNMKHRVPIVTLLALTVLISRTAAAFEQPEPGPEAGGLRLSLVVTPHPEGGKEGYDVEVGLMNVSREAILLRANRWRSTRQEGGFQELLEAAVSIESSPAIGPWLGQVQVMPPLEGVTPELEHTLKSGQTLSLKWHTTGRHLKNSVSNPLEVQNPEFTENGLHSVQASLVITAAGSVVRLRSNEQLVPIGGSREMPKHTYGALRSADEKTKTATLGLGSLDKVVRGDRFLIHSGTIGMTWTLTLTNVEADHCTGTLEPSRVNPTPAFPRQGWNAALLPKK